jgi:penicillin G amidase
MGARRRTLKWAVGVVVTLALLLAVTAIGAIFWLMQSGKPVRHGELRLTGLSAPVQVRWDDWGVPHLSGQSGVDLAMVQGFLHANDRMTQMELGRRAASGRLSEVIGNATLDLDIEARTLRLRAVAEIMWEAMEAESRQWLVAYSQGVNAWLMMRRHDLPPALRLLRIEPEPWTVIDSLSFVVLMARDLSFWQGRPEELRFEWLSRFDVEGTRELLGVPDAHVPDAILSAARYGIQGAAPVRRTRAPSGSTSQALHVSPPAASGSNNWAIGAARSADGLPLVANDLHLPMVLPATWYQVHLRAPDYQVMGISLPGMPGVVVGQSEHLAWSLTSAMVDDHDLFFEQVDPAILRVLRGDGWVPLEIEHTEILVRGQEPVTLTLRATDHGPLLPADQQNGLPARSLAWTAYLAGDPLAAFVHLARAQSVDEIPDGIGSFTAPAQNLVAADRRGGLLHVLMGGLPERRLGDGRVPAPGWDPAYGWDGLRDAATNPRLPPGNDTLVTANDDMRPPDYALPLVHDVDLPARAQRIRDLLERRPEWRANDMATIQTDVVSLYARELVALSAGEHSGTAAQAYESLAGWDGAMSLEGPSALFVLFEQRLAEAVFGNKVDLGRVSGPVLRTWLLRLLRGDMSEAWFEGDTAAAEGRHAVIERTLAQVWDEGVARWGAEVGRWSYGDLNQLTLRHPLGVVPIVGRYLDRGPFAVAGSATTVAAFVGAWSPRSRYPAFGPTIRWISVVGDGDRSLVALPGGQSGHPFDRHYDDQIELFFQERMRPVTWSEEAIRGATVSILNLTP